MPYCESLKFMFRSVFKYQFKLNHCIIMNMLDDIFFNDSTYFYLYQATNLKNEFKVIIRCITDVDKIVNVSNNGNTPKR